MPIPVIDDLQTEGGLKFVQIGWCSPNGRRNGPFLRVSLNEYQNDMLRMFLSAPPPESGLKELPQDCMDALKAQHDGVGIVWRHYQPHPEMVMAGERPLQEGDVVRLRSGGPRMTVQQLRPAMTEVVWFEPHSSQPQTAQFPLACLERCPSAKE